MNYRSLLAVIMNTSQRLNQFSIKTMLQTKREEKNRMTEYMVLLKLSPSKILDAIDNLRKIPENGIQGIDTYYTMNIFGTWDVGVWFNAENTKLAMDCVHNSLKTVTGVTDSYILPMFPPQE